MKENKKPNNTLIRTNHTKHSTSKSQKTTENWIGKIEQTDINFTLIKIELLKQQTHTLKIIKLQSPCLSGVKPSGQAQETEFTITYYSGAWKIMSNLIWPQALYKSDAFFVKDNCNW